MRLMQTERNDLKLNVLMKYIEGRELEFRNRFVPLRSKLIDSNILVTSSMINIARTTKANQKWEVINLGIMRNTRLV